MSSAPRPPGTPDKSALWAVAAGLLGLGLLMAALPAPAAPDDRPLPALHLPATGDPLRLVAVGTSLTAGYDWPDRLAESLALCLSHPVEIAVIARAGAGSSWAVGPGLETLRAAVRAAPPHLVVLELAINDADLRDGVSRARSRAQHGAVLDGLDGLLAPGGTVVLMATNPVQGALRHLQRPRLGAYYALYRDLAAARGLGFADLTTRWRTALAAAPAPLLPDGLHPDPAAARAVIVPAMTGLIAAAFGVQGCTGRTG